MKKGKLAIIAALLVSGSVIGGITANATQVGAGKTDTSIGFKQDTIIPPTNGELSLVSTPANMDFGQNNEVDVMKTSYPTVTNNVQYLIVRDDRDTAAVAVEDQPGDWKLTANASVVKEANGTESIVGASYSFSPNGGTYTNTNTKIDPSGNGTDTIADWQNPAIPNASTVNSVLPSVGTIVIGDKEILTTGETATLATSTGGGTAEQNEAFALKMSDFSLSVPPKDIATGKTAAKAGTSYVGEINWVLDNTAL